MRALKLALALLVVLLIHFLGNRLVPGFARAIDLFLVIVVLHALDGNSLAGLLGGWIVGLAHDALVGGPFGLFGFVDTIIGYGAARLAQRLVIQRTAGVLLLVAVASLLQEALLTALSVVLLPERLLPMLPWLAVRAVTSGVVGAIAFGLGKRWRAFTQDRRLHKVKRLRLE